MQKFQKSVHISNKTNRLYNMLKNVAFILIVKIKNSNKLLIFIFNFEKDEIEI